MYFYYKIVRSVKLNHWFWHNCNGLIKKYLLTGYFIIIILATRCIDRQQFTINTLLWISFRWFTRGFHILDFYKHASDVTGLIRLFSNGMLLFVTTWRCGNVVEDDNTPVQSNLVLGYIFCFCLFDYCFNCTSYDGRRTASVV